LDDSLAVKVSIKAWKTFPDHQSIVLDQLPLGAFQVVEFAGKNYLPRVGKVLAIKMESMHYRRRRRPTNQTRKRRLTMANVQKTTDSSSLAEVVDRILDKGIVIDAWAKVALVGIELLSVEARIVIASVETYLKYAEAIGLTATAAAPA
jgi:hypothetical protein